MPALDFINQFNSLQLDIVGFLAILGEGSVLSTSGVATLSKWIFLPRLLPAPQALLRPSRPTKLDPISGTVTGVYSGNIRGYVNHVGNVVVDAEGMEKWCVRVVEIKRVPRRDAEKNADQSYGSMKAKTWSPLTLLSALGSVFSIGILIVTIVYDDGMGLLAILLLSLLSTLIGIGNKWTLKFTSRPNTYNRDIPPGDVVIRYPQGSFLIVKCDEEIARELYFAPEVLEYLVQKPAVYRLISLIGTLMLMFGVIALGNSKKKTQVAFALSFLLLNAFYWVVAALPNRLNWDTSCFDVKKQRLATSNRKHFIDQSHSYTQALFKTICVTRDIEWVKKNGAAPDTPAWDRWLRESRDTVRKLPRKKPDKNGVDTWAVPDKSSFDPQLAMQKLVADLHAATSSVNG